jgi:D-alanyl-D-alanine carboxypeptidase
MKLLAEGSFPLRRYRIIAAALCVLAAGTLAAEPALARYAPPGAAMAIDANTGAVLYDQAGDEHRFPASLTKMMTLYLTFELIELGRLDYQSKIKMTEEGAAVSPSKLGLKPGEEITVIDAIKALVTKSANDVATALGQHIGGTEANFARLMTKKAREIGMSHTTFKNASGLPDSDQVTTARDMLTLALRLQDEFPQEYKLFATRTFTFRGHTYRNHNGLLGHYAGTDGIKTGYTRASGFNLVTSVHRGGKHVVAAVFGGKTSRNRNTRMRAILNKVLPKASRKKTREPARFMRPPSPVAVRRPARPAPVASLPPPPPRQAPAPAVSGGPVAAAARGPTISVAKVRSVPFGADPGSTSAVPAVNQEQGSTGARIEGASLPSFAKGMPPSTLQAQAAALGGGAPPIAARPEPAVHEAPARGRRGPFAIQIGAYNDSTDAEQHMASVRQRVGGLLDPYHAAAVPVQKGSSQFYRARFRGFDATAAASTCTKLRSMQIDCFVVRTE